MVLYSEENSRSSLLKNLQKSTRKLKPTGQCIDKCTYVQCKVGGGDVSGWECNCVSVTVSGAGLLGLYACEI